MSDDNTQSMTDEELIARFGAEVGTKAGEMAAECLSFAQILSALGGRPIGRIFLQQIIDTLTIERERLR